LGYADAAPREHFGFTRALVLVSNGNEMFQVTKIVWVDTKLPLVATGIEFATYTNTTNGTTRFTAHARKEVIVAAGALRVRILLVLPLVDDTHAYSHPILFN
jgi:hypothetical protein